MTVPAHDVVVIGDGPAARALGRACHARGLDVVVVGPDRPWTSTFGAWTDEVGEHRGAFAVESPIDVVAAGRRRVRRTYGVFHNQRLRTSLDVAPRLVDTVTEVRHHLWGAAVHTGSGSKLTARVVVDAAGAGGVVLDRVAGRVPPSFQTAYGLVLPERPDVGGDVAVLMDWRIATVDPEPSFLYVLPLEGGRWLIEETSLARRVPMGADELRQRLAARLGHDHTDRAEHVEHVRIPMRPGLPSLLQPTVGFGAAAGYVHPATGYSVTASLRAADRVAGSIAEVLGTDASPAQAARAVWQRVWPVEQRRARALHDYGLAALLRMDATDIGVFFDAFFALPDEIWAPYLRVDATAAEVGRVMRGVFSRVPWSLRRRLATGNPAAFARLVR
jgi:lycopene beta-cyclase